ncbi:MAG: glycosyltransferase family 4 protein [Planctomycetes bacterium]|nr:glycosyltransferase family 4 protein [Planctomycetota bacterium]
MKVLMLGWEFPPHISGGLGTACFGLTQGLSHHGVEVAFVVPKAWGDEDQRFVKLVGANTVPVPTWTHVQQTVPGPKVETRRTVEWREPEEVVRVAPRVASATVEIPPEPRKRDEAVATTLRLLEVESALRPYLGEVGWLEHLVSVTGLSRDELVRRFEAAPEESRRAVGGLKRALFTAAAEGDPRSIDTAILREERLSFSGFYGPDLMAEVARYALVVGEVARREPFDVVHAHDWMTYPAGIVAARVAKKPLVVHLHASEYDRSGENVNERVRALEQLGLATADRVICVSHYTENAVRSRYQVDAAKLRVVHNAVTHKEQVEGWQGQKHIREPIVLFLGRVTFQKGPDYFLEAAARVVKVEPKVKFVMSGSGDMLPKMIERAARLGLARHVHFTGFLKGEEVERMYAMADIYVMPSVSEPFGISPLEAMALDVPVVLSRQSGVSEVLRNALKVDFWDVQDMANKILALIRYPALAHQLTEEGKGELATFRWDLRGKLVRAVYEEVVR